MDGNFAMAPNLFAQLYVIIAGHMNIWTYEHMLTALQEKVAERLEMYPNLNIIILDFGIAIINAIGGVLENGITINCCFFHLCQSTFRKLQKIGLKNLHVNDQELELFVGMLDGLAFLPPDQIVQGMEHLINLQPLKLND